MTRNSTPIRAVGQRPISATSLFRPIHNCNKEGSNEDSERRKSESNVTLTSFLNRKLRTTSPVFPVHKAKEEKFRTPSDQNGPGGSNDTREHHLFEKPHEGRTCMIEESVFKLFSGSEEKIRKRSSDCPSGTTAPSYSNVNVVKDTQKHLLVLGDDPKPKRRAYRCYRKGSNNEEKSRPLYNYYENGTGWWDSDREGVDNDEVGHKEVWEGVGSTTLGGLDWH